MSSCLPNVHHNPRRANTQRPISAGAVRPPSGSWCSWAVLSSSGTAPFECPKECIETHCSEVFIGDGAPQGDAIGARSTDTGEDALGQGRTRLMDTKFNRAGPGQFSRLFGVHPPTFNGEGPLEEHYLCVEVVPPSERI